VDAGREAPMAGFLVGVDVGGTRIKVGLADIAGQLLSCNVLETHGVAAAASLQHVA